MVILHTADSHIGAALPSRPRRPGPRRGDDLVDSFRGVLRQAAERDVDLVVHSGDLFNRSNPSSRALAAAADPLLELAVAGVPVVIVPGNHERSTIPATLLLSHPNIHIIREPTTLTFAVGDRRVAVSGVPCLRRDSAKRFPAALEATAWHRARADVRVLAVHQTFESATCGPGGYRFRSGEDVVERDAVPAEFDYVAAGHIHRHQVLSRPQRDGPPIVYCGSPDRVSFAEVDEPKGSVVVEENGGGLAHTFVEHDVRPMSVWPVNVTGLAQARIREQIAAIIGKLPERAIAQVRLSGCSTPDALRGLRFTAMARELRPDVLLTASTQAVELAPHRQVQRWSRPTASAFSDLDAPAVDGVRASVEEVKRLPTGCGVYALHDAVGRLLYVGKAKNVRARVRTHVRGKTGANRFAGWGRQIARVEVRPADSELEALLIEAELIRRLRPPFNRQMRKWTGYCYLRENGKPYGQLEVCRQAGSGDRCFGPFRSRKLAAVVGEAVADHFGLAQCPDQQPLDCPLPLLPGVSVGRQCRRYYDKMCVGPCGGRVDRSDYDRRIRRRDALLTGEDDASLRALEAQLEKDPVEGSMNDRAGDSSRPARTLRSTFDYCATLREAEGLLHGLLLLPGADGVRKTAGLAPRGIRFDLLRNDADDANRVLERHRACADPRAGHGRGRLPTSALDALCIAARHLRDGSKPYHFIAPGELGAFGGYDLLAVAFGANAKSVVQSTIPDAAL